VARKVKSFADKMLAKADVTTCPVCGEAQQNVVIVQPERDSETNHYRYTRSSVKVCKCNEKEVYA